jgi:tellurite resistance protein TerC
MTAVPVWAWVATFGVLAVLIAVDLVLMSRIGDGLRAAAIESALWLGAALAFGAVVWLWRGPATGGQYLAGYLLERALSVDNIFVFVLLFVSLQVPAALQRRILFLGVVGALVLRGAFIAAGGALIERVSWIFYVFGAIVLLAGARMFRSGEGHGVGSGSPGSSGDSLAVRGLRRVLPVSERYDGSRLLTRTAGRLAATPLLVALVAIAVTDVVFALDSIPAVFGVTRDLFVVFTSNAFAVLGLRALYFLLAGSADRFVYLKPGIALLLVFIGVKMLLYDVVHMPVWVSLVVIAAVGGGAVAASLWRDRRRDRRRLGPPAGAVAPDAVAPDAVAPDAVAPDREGDAGGAVVPDRDGDGAAVRADIAGDGVSADHEVRGTVRT